MASVLPNAAKATLLDYCRAITQVNAAASILNHNKRILKGLAKTQEDLSCHVLDSDYQI
ncbi:hypothetical protein [Endozoicomonas sp. ALC066]|uniref:hypothetical protein n=1 Tax=Endozoicomonas sp. ALC066 TaxID=3403078 RepID=UPI003BB668A2